MPRESASEPNLHPARLQVRVVVNHDQPIGLDLEETGRRADGSPRLVHVRLRFQEREPEPVRAYLGQLAGELSTPGAAVPARQLVGGHEADVVARIGIFAPRIPEPGDE